MRCGGVLVEAGDLIVADEEGVVVVPGAREAAVLREARARLAAEAATSLDEWELEHRMRIDRILRDRGFEE